MAKLTKKLNLVKARRRVRMRSALSLALGVCLLLTVYRMLLALGGGLAGLPGWLMGTLMTIACFGGGAYLGLCVLDGNQTKIVPRGTLSRAQTLWLSLLGVLAICPMTLAADITRSLLPGAQVAGSAASGASAPGMFLLLLLKSALLTPVLEELFFRGYLLNAMERCGKERAAAASALCFALVHAAGDGTAWVYIPLGLLLGALTMKTGSLLAPVLVHGCYNLALILASYLGLGGLFSGLTLLSCALRLAGCLVFAYCLRRAWMARGTGARLQPMEKLTKKEWALVAVAVLLAAAVCVMR